MWTCLCVRVSLSLSLCVWLAYVKSSKQKWKAQSECSISCCLDRQPYKLVVYGVRVIRLVRVYLLLFARVWLTSFVDSNIFFVFISVFSVRSLASSFTAIDIFDDLDRWARTLHANRVIILNCWCVFGVYLGISNCPQKSVTIVPIEVQICGFTDIFFR